MQIIHPNLDDTAELKALWKNIFQEPIAISETFLL